MPTGNCLNYKLRNQTMRKIRLILTFTGILMISAYASCTKGTSVAVDTVDPAKIYTGVIIAKDCPSYAFIQISDANIGDDWTPNTTYKNMIGISNCPDSVSGTVNFQLSTSKNILDCQIQKACPAVVLFPSYPKKIFCSTNIKIVKK